MPKPSDYTPARHRVMQAAMWAILGLTIALAAVVGASARRANRVELSSQPTVVGEVSVRLPAKWTASKARDPRVVAQATDPSPGAGGRTVSIWLDRLRTPASPLQYLVDELGLGVQASGESQDDVSQPLTLPIAGRTGVLVFSYHPDDEEGPGMKQAFACAVLPSQRVLVVHLFAPGLPEPSDLAIVKQIAAAVTIQREPALGAAGERVVLPDGIELTVPPGFAAIEETDANVTQRTLWSTRPPAKSAEEFEQDWTTVELVSCAWPALAGSDAQQKSSAALATLLLVRDPMWRGAAIERIAGNVWHARAVQPSSGGFPAHAYLMSHAGERALLATFHAGFQGGGFEPLWKQLAGTVKFTGSSDLSALQDMGSAEANRLRRAGLEKRVERDEQWWLWTDFSDHPHLGWSHVELLAGGLRGKRSTMLRQAGSGTTTLAQEFTYRDIDASYHCATTRTVSEQELRQTTDVKAGRLSLSIRTPGGAVTEVKAPLPPQFLPGALLPMLMVHLEPRAMLLRSDSFLLHETVGAPEPLTLIVRPAENTTRVADGETRPMRCLTAQVNGSGSLSRWYFRRSGELECVEFAGRLQRVPSDPKQVELNFGKDGKLAP